METFKILKLDFNLLRAITADKINIDIMVHSKNRKVQGRISYIGCEGSIGYLTGAFLKDDGRYNHTLITKEAVIVIAEDSVFITHDFDKFKKYLNYEEITLNDDLVQIFEKSSNGKEIILNDDLIHNYKIKENKMRRKQEQITIRETIAEKRRKKNQENPDWRL